MLNSRAFMRWVDLAVVLLYLIGITWFGARFKEGQKTLRDYFLGGRNAPWWAIGFSIVSAETSTLTVIGTPALAFNGNLGFLQVVFGYLLARLVISTLFLPQYFKGELFTAYELMQRRFGQRIRKLTAGCFLVLRALAEGVRVFAISIVIQIILGTGEVASIVLIVCLTLFYTFEGGMTAVIWTDVVQMFLYVAGAILSFFVILGQVPGGWDEVVRVGTQFNKFQVINLNFAWDSAYNIWAGVIGGCFLTTASHGTEQLMVQRLLAAKNLSESRKALLSSWFVIAFQFTLFLLIGVALFVYYRSAGIAPPVVADQIYPAFIWKHLPPVVAGLVMAAILAAAMSNLSAALNALASTTIMDFVKPMTGSRHTEDYYLRLARWATVLWGLGLFVIGWASSGVKSVLEAALGIASIVYGSLLGVFLLGLLTKRAGEVAAMVGMSTALLVMIYVRFATTIAWTWHVLIGTSVTFAVGWILGFVFRQEKSDA
ncbi:MAG: sodium:solute symporter [Acidobacteria bacterium]|nr:sodium:solute symporter [Acidobacteriota bacterium]